MVEIETKDDKPPLKAMWSESRDPF